ncbi:Alpha/Beta hydrolase protein [Tuber indicum]|nr:Alpha/Beta hydrolase protein [Tuber indicum]
MGFLRKVRNKLLGQAKVDQAGPEEGSSVVGPVKKGKETSNAKVSAETPIEPQAAETQREGLGQEEGEREEERFGLFVVTPQDRNAVVDIVALHGLGGDRFRTWTHDSGACWIRDFLPEQIPGARIMTFGYNSGVAFSQNVAGISVFANDLLDRLKGLRRHIDESTRPIIFICHSLGGIVCKRSLVLSHEQPMYQDILKSTHGIVFMGTPHRGSTIADWTKMFASIVNNVLISTLMRSDLLKDLQTNSRALQEITSSFKYRTSGLQIVTFYEQEITAPLKKLVVDMDSAILDLPNERPVPVNANHRDICKFSHAKSEKYRPVWVAISDMVSSIPVDRAVATESSM